MNIIIVLIISVVCNGILAHINGKLRYINADYKRRLGGDMPKIPTSKEVMEAWEEKHFRQYLIYTIFPFLSNVRSRVIDSGQKGKEIMDRIVYQLASK